MTFSAAPVLSHRLARLEPLAHAHHDDLCAAVGDLHTLWYTSIPSPDTMTAEIDRRLAQQRDDAVAPWAIVDARTGRAVGMTTYLNLDPENRRLEIGSTWLGREAQGTGVNPAVKLLLLARAFDALGCMAVEFRTHWHNHQSRTAIARLGAHQDGVLRQHKVWTDGSIRDTVVFSILDREWPSVRLGLESRVASR
ncbi:GNAT family N-acetyltransferase [Demequina lignilytica]|uniref:GNAT family protein n=1 Tax=Demequina lignilytica TaxID=3051663 RepID=A0AAW7M4Y8_9MICO|nr:MULTISPECIES: GNAT family protein [unclassified Demequina]MDN4482242.1 GNAT family protein [Demequina sp. SYSU T0a273]MDN4486901.1 GNAT family protein [Demequina sp. SYSU T00039]MDN4489585.1 GNAT family protein [Demequina sp. SYSU T00068]